MIRLTGVLGTTHSQLGRFALGVLSAHGSGYELPTFLTLSSYESDLTIGEKTAGTLTFGGKDGTLAVIDPARTIDLGGG